MNHSTPIYLENKAQIPGIFILQHLQLCVFCRTHYRAKNPRNSLMLLMDVGDNPDFLKILEEAVDSIRNAEEFHLGSAKV